ncbi:hypothetical protein ACVR05_06630 [Streptococcus caprae]|uniref:Uncharacterized protein n=1 Tax=Streptococcus caprae TaxID=1640501 RepID=A0ABV8CWE8_9STRE
MKFKKSISLGMTILALAQITAPAATVLANENVDSVQSELVTQTTVMSNEAKDALVRDVMTNHPTVSESFIREAIELQLRGDYSIPGADLSTTAFRSAWQGITVDQMGALIDTAIGTALGAGVGGLAAAIKSSGKEAAKSALKTALVKYGLIGTVISQPLLDFALNLISPGHHIATYWDQHDAVPNNGRINF